MRELFKHRFAYTFLIIGIIVMIGLYMAVWPDRFWQRAISVLFAAFYISWGVATHFKAEHITNHIIYEYLGIGLLGGTILLLLTF